MKCSDITNELPLYADDELTAEASAGVRDHLAACPLCRQRCSEYREIRSELRSLRRPEMNVAMQARLRSAVKSEVRREQHSALPIGSDLRVWLQMRLMPYAVGVVATSVISFSFLTSLMSGSLLRGSNDLSSLRSDSPSVALASRRDPFLSTSYMSVSPADFAGSRSAFASESPSVNPQGALAALAKSLVRGKMKDEEVVVVADVFGDGLAQISEVVESPRDGRAVSELERAFNAPGSSPFVPSVMENRPQNMRIILKVLGSIDVNGSSPAAERY